MPGRQGREFFGIAAIFRWNVDAPPGAGAVNRHPAYRFRNDDESGNRATLVTPVSARFARADAGLTHHASPSLTGLRKILPRIIITNLIQNTVVNITFKSDA